MEWGRFFPLSNHLISYEQTPMKMTAQILPRRRPELQLTKFHTTLFGIKIDAVGDAGFICILGVCFSMF